MLKIKSNEILTNSAEILITRQNIEDGSFPAGYNGPYRDPETAVRNTAHALYLLADLYQRTGNLKYKVSGEKAIGFLFGRAARPFQKTFHCRDKEGKDHCNGLVGQAWVMEALIKASVAFKREDCYDLAEEVFILHPWDESVGIWQRIEIDGQVMTYDGTFNHQLWFAAVAAQLYRTPIAQERALCFLHKVAAKISLYRDGVIFHSSPMGTLNSYFSRGFLNFARAIKRRVFIWLKFNQLYSKSVGYHGFNLYAFAMLKEVFPNEPFWGSNLFNKIINVVSTSSFKQSLFESEFGYFYNVSGIEIAYALESFSGNLNDTEAWLNQQFKYTFEDECHPLTKGVVDRSTAMARIYQQARLSNNYEIRIG